MLVSHPSSAFSALLVFSARSDLIAASSPGGALVSYPHCSVVQLRLDLKVSQPASVTDASGSPSENKIQW